MKILRKLTAAILVVSLLFASMTAVFAADSATIANADKAVTLKDLGLYSGQDANNPKVGLEDALTTQDSLIFLAKLFGYNEAANKLTADQVTEALAKFDDAASISDYAKNVVAYSSANSILCGSIQDGKLFVGAKDTVTAARFATFMLKQMGYTVPDFRLSVAQLAETKGSKIDATITGGLTRDSAVGIMYGALTAEKASGKTVIADIVSDNVDLKAKAANLGLIAPTKDHDSGSDELRVVSVNALNNKQLEIKFNLPLNKDSAQDEANYEIKDKGNVEKILTGNSCKLSNDMKTVTITLDYTVEDCLTNSSTAKVKLSKEIMTSNGEKLGTDKELEVHVQDGMLPTVKEIKATGERNIKIIFSEPIYEGNNNLTIINRNLFAVKSGTYTYFVQKAELNLDAINLEVATKFIEGPVTVTVNDAGLQGNAIQDYAGYKVFKGSHTFNYVKDTTVPVVTVKSAKGNKVVLNFSKPVKGTNINLYHSDKKVEDYKAKTTTDGYVDEITFTFKNILPTGALNLFLVNSENYDEKLIDGYGIKVPDKTLTCSVEIDAAAPVVRHCIVNKNESIKIEFNEELDIEVAQNQDSYLVKRLSDNEVIPLSAVIDSSLKSVELKFDPVLDDNTEYQLLIKNYKDISGNNASDYEYIFITLDYTNPEVDNPKTDERCYTIAEKGEIFIVYSEAMNEAQMLDKGNYQVSIDGGNTYKALGVDDTITKIDDSKVQIYVKELDDNNENIILKVKIAPITDLAGNRLYGSDNYHIVEEIAPEYVCIENAQLIAKNKIKLVFNKKMESIDVNDIELTTNTNTTTSSSIKVLSCESTAVNSDGKTEVVLVLDKDLSTDGRDEAGNEIFITTIAAPSSESESGSKLTYCWIDICDKTPPEIVMWDYDNDESTDDISKVIAGGDIANPQVYDSDYNVPHDTTGFITIYFSEDIKETTLTKDTFKVAGFTITNITAPAETKTVILEVIANADNTSVNTTVTQVSEIYDTADNAFVQGSTWAVSLEYKPLTT